MATTSVSAGSTRSAEQIAAGRIRVLHVCERCSFDGFSDRDVGRMFSWWFPRFDRDRFDVRLVALRRADRVAYKFESAGIPITYLGTSRYSAWTLPALLRLMSRMKPDLLHLHGHNASVVGRVAAIARGVPAIVHAHFADAAVPLFQVSVDRLLAPVAAHTIAVARWVRDCCIENCRLDPARVSVVYSGIPFDEFKSPGVTQIATARDELGISPEARIIGTVGRLDREKGTEFLIRAMPAIIAKHPSVTLVILGDGVLRSELDRLCIRLGVSNRVIFAGFRNDVAALLALFEVMIIPSLGAGIPLTVFEAMALARPIVASNVDGLREVLVDGHTALLTSPADPAALSNRINALLAQPRLQQQLSRNCEHECRKYDVRGTVEKMQEIYLRLARVAKQDS